MPSRPRLTAVGAAPLALALAACSSSGTDDTAPPVASASASATASATGSSPTTGPVDPRVSGTVASDLKAPWGLAFLPDGSALVSQRDEGSIVRVSDDGTVLPV